MREQTMDDGRRGANMEKERGGAVKTRDKRDRKRAFGMDGFIPFAPQNSHGGGWTELLFFRPCVV